VEAMGKLVQWIFAFSENSDRRTSAREEGKRETDENAIELVIGDKRRKYRLR